MLNHDLTKDGEERRLQLSELEEIGVEAYKSARSTRKGLSYFMIDIFLRKSLPQE